MRSILYRIILSLLLLGSWPAQCDAPRSFFVYVHGLCRSGAELVRYNGNSSDKLNIMPGPSSSFDFPDVPLSWNLFRVNRHNVVLGQEIDIAVLRTHIDNLVQTTNFVRGHDRIVLIGTSRGAATIINFVALHYDEFPEIAALILHAPYDHILSVVRHVAGKYLKNMCAAFIAFAFPRYNPAGIHPIALVEKLPIHMPILFVTSYTDQLVPWQSTYNLYCVAQASGHTYAHYICLHRGRHGNLFFGADKWMLEKIVYSFYALYDIYQSDVAVSHESFTHMCEVVNTPVYINTKN